MDMLFMYAATYATSSIVLPVVQAAKAPVVLLNIHANCSPFAFITTRLVRFRYRSVRRSTQPQRSLR